MKHKQEMERLYQSIEDSKQKPKKIQYTPYSILAGNSQEDWDQQKSHLESILGSRTTRANLMAQMHVKKKFNETLEAGRIQKMLNKQEILA